MRIGRLLAAIGLAAVLAACSAPATSTEAEPEDSGAPDGSEAAEEEGGGGVEAVLAELEGLEGEERRTRLIELAEEEGGLTLYTSLNAEIADEILSAFEDATGIEPGIYRASSETVRTRLSEEASAGAMGADVVETNGPELVILSQEGIFADVEPPNADDLVEGSLQEGWTGSRNNIFTAAWNTDNVPADQAPTEWADLADPRWDGTLVLEPDDAEWYMGLYLWMTEEEGMSEEDADAFFQEVADGAVSVSGHSTMRQLLAAGEYDLLASDYSYGVEALVNEGAPVAWEPPVEPLLSRPNGVAVPADAQNPASGLLFYEWLLDEGQETLVELEFTPVRSDLVETGGAEVITVDLERYVEEAEDWQTRYEELISGTEQVEAEGR